MRLILSQKSWIYFSLFSFLCLISKAVYAAVPMQFGILVEPGYEYRTLKDTPEEGEKFKLAGLSGTAIGQLMFVTKSPLVPFVGLGFNYAQLEGKKKINEVDTKLTFKGQQSAIVEAGLGFVLHKQFRLELFGDYQQLISGKFEVKHGDDDPESDKLETKIKFGKNMKYRVGARFFVTAWQRFDFGLSGAYNLGNMTPKVEDAKEYKYNGFQANLVVRMRLGNTR